MRQIPRHRTTFTTLPYRGGVLYTQFEEGQRSLQAIFFIINTYMFVVSYLQPGAKLLIVSPSYHARAMLVKFTLITGHAT